MFCGKCGSKIADGNAFCTICGAPITLLNSPHTVQQVVLVPSTSPTTTQIKAPETQPALTTVSLSDKWPWLLATIPMSVSIALTLVMPSNTTIIAIIVLVLNIIFASLDDNYLKKKEIQTKAWMWMGFILVPVYLFVRAGKTNKHFGPGIVWCVLAGIDLIISVANSMTSIA